MLQPIKSTQATTATQATEPSDAVTPISEQRPGQTLRDRLFQGAEISGGATKKTSSSSATNNSPNLYQQYSLAKNLPATPIAPKTGGYIGGMLGQTGSFNDYWANISKYASTGPQEMEYEYINGVGTLTSKEEMDIKRRWYANGAMGNFNDYLKSQREIENRLANKYYSGDITREIRPHEYDSPMYSGLITGRKGEPGVDDGPLSSDELKTLLDVAKNQHLGQSGYEALVQQATASKAYYSAKSQVDVFNNAIKDPDNTDWNVVASTLGINPETSVSKLKDGKQFIDFNAMDYADAGALIIGGSLLANAIAPLMGASAMGPWGAAAAGIATIVAMLSTSEDKTLNEAKFNPIKNGKLANSINDFSGSEKSNIEYLAEKTNKTPDEIVQYMKAVFLSELQTKAGYRAKEGNMIEQRNANDMRISYGDNGINQSQAYIKGQENWAGVGQGDAYYWGSYRDIQNTKW